jgi:hypothetical protein
VVNVAVLHGCASHNGVPAVERRMSYKSNLELFGPVALTYFMGRSLSLR